MPSLDPVEIVGELQRLIFCPEDFIEAGAGIAKNIDCEHTTGQSATGVLKQTVEGIRVTVQETQCVGIRGHQRSVADGEDELVGKSWGKDMSVIDRDQKGAIIIV